MRKYLLDSLSCEAEVQPSSAWLDLERIAQVQVTSEDPDYPVEAAFSFGKGPGWRAGGRGEQTIRLIFDQPQRLRRLWLRFEETSIERTQEFALRWCAHWDDRRQEIVRQQWNFGPHGSRTEIEDYAVDLDGVLFLELIIEPDLRRRQAFATLADWRIA